MWKKYLGHSGSRQEEDSQQRKEDTPRVHGMGDGGEKSSKNANRRQGLARPSSVYQCGRRWNSDCGLHGECGGADVMGCQDYKTR